MCAFVNQFAPQNHYVQEECLDKGVRALGPDTHFIKIKEIPRAIQTVKLKIRSHRMKL